MTLQSVAYAADLRFGAGLVGLCGKAVDLQTRDCLQSDARDIGNDSALRYVAREKWVRLR